MRQITGAKLASSAAWIDRPCVTGFYATTPKASPGFATAWRPAETATHPRAGV